MRLLQVLVAHSALHFVTLAPAVGQEAAESKVPFFSGAEFAKQWKADEDAFQAKYLNKVIEIEDTIFDVVEVHGRLVLKQSGVWCLFETDAGDKADQQAKARKMQHGQTIRVKGLFRRDIGYKVLFNAEIIKTGKPPRSAEELAALKRLKELGVTTLDYTGSPYVPNSVTGVIQISYNSEFHAKDLELLSPLAQLRQLQLEGNQIDDSWLPYIAKLKQVTSITLSTSKLEGKGLEQLAKELPNLERLELLRTPLEVRNLAFLRHAKKLWHLKLDPSPDLTDEGLEYLKQLTTLSSLEVESELTWAAFENVGGLKSLKRFRRLDDWE